MLHRYDVAQRATSQAKSATLTASDVAKYRTKLPRLNKTECIGLDMENAQAHKNLYTILVRKPARKTHLRHGRRSDDNIKPEVKVWCDCGLDLTGSRMASSEISYTM